MLDVASYLRKRNPLVKKLTEDLNESHNKIADLRMTHTVRIKNFNEIRDNLEQVIKDFSKENDQLTNALAEIREASAQLPVHFVKYSEDPHGVKAICHVMEGAATKIEDQDCQIRQLVRANRFIGITFAVITIGLVSAIVFLGM